jgi:hypothetical protein
MDFQTTIKHDSKACHGVSFTVRRLNVIQRARRDGALLAHRAEWRKRLAEYAAFRREQLGEMKAEERDAKIAALAPDVQARLMTLEHEADQIHFGHILPGTILAAFHSVDGFFINGKNSQTPQEFIESAPDELLIEVYEACEAASGLSEEQQKNLPPPGTSAGREVGSSQASTVEPAGNSGSTPIETA